MTIDKFRRFIDVAFLLLLAGGLMTATAAMMGPAIS